MANTSRKTVTVVAVGRYGEWVVCTPDGRTHRGATLREAMAAAAASEVARVVPTASLLKPNPSKTGPYRVHALHCLACAEVDAKVIGARRCGSGMTLMLNACLGDDAEVR